MGGTASRSDQVTSVMEGLCRCFQGPSLRARCRVISDKYSLDKRAVDLLV